MISKIRKLFKNSIVVISLFDGISCGHVALDRAGIEVSQYYAYEIDKFAIKVTQSNYPKTIQMGNVINADFKKFVGKIDLLMGGSPCQNLSIIGNHKGLKGEQSKLFYEFVRALNEIRGK